MAVYVVSYADAAFPYYAGERIVSSFVAYSVMLLEKGRLTALIRLYIVNKRNSL